MAVDSLWSNVTLLLPCSADLLDVKQHAVTVVGNTALSSAVGTPFGAGNACYFDGSGDRLTLASSTDWAVGTGDFFIECWVYPTSFPGGAVTNDLTLFNVDGSPQFYFYLDRTTGKPTLWNGTNGYQGANAVTLNAWNYVWCRRASSTLTIGIGTTTGITQASYTSNFTASSVVTIGGAPDGSRNLFGYIGGMRITRASRTIAIPSAPFPRPTISGVVLNSSAAPVEKTILVVDRSSQRMLGGTTSSPSTGAYLFYPPDFGECEVKRLDEVCDPPTHEAVFSLDCRGKPGGLIHTDHFGSLVSWFGSAKIDTDGQSVRLTRSSLDRIEATPPNIRLGTHDFSIDLEFLPVSAGGTNAYARLLAIGPNDVAGSLYIIKNNNDNPMTFRFETYSGGSYQTILDYVATTVSDAWHKLQLRRTNGVLSAYVDGVLYATKACTVDFTGTTIAVGGRVNGHENFDCNIRSVRVSKGPTRGATTIPSATLLKMPTDGGSGENALIYDRVIPG